MPLRWLPAILWALSQVLRDLGQLSADDIAAEYAEPVRLSAGGPWAEKHFGPIAPGTRHVDAPHPTLPLTSERPRSG
jgi:hypothetical protein